VGSGARAHAWHAWLARSTTARVVAIVARHPASVPADLEAARFATLDAALAAFPTAKVAAALPPRASLEVALALAERAREGLVEAPLHHALARLALPPAASKVQVAHGWVTLPGVGWFARTIVERAERAERAGRASSGSQTLDALEIQVAGLPEEPGGDVEEALAHALALVARLSPEARVTGAVQPRESQLEIALAGPGGLAIRVIARAEGHGLELRARGPGLEVSLRVEGETETRTGRLASGRVESQPRVVPVATLRALHQLVAPERAGGDDLVAAKRVAELVAASVERRGRRPALGGRPLRDAARIARAYPSEPLARLGLRGTIALGAPAPRLRVPACEEPLELWPFRAGRKPVAFLTARPDEVERLVACFDGAHVERRERRVHVGAQDAWIDRRDLGEPRVELYVSRDPALAREAARLQTEGDPSASLAALGALMGYPACCVAAFAAQADRSNNTRNRYESAARTAAGAPWPWELANLHTMLIPCYPCSYACPAALDLARASLAEMERAHAGTVAALRTMLARPVLYFDHEHQIVLDGRTAHAPGATGATGAMHEATVLVRYDGVSVTHDASPDFAAFAGAVGDGDELQLLDDALIVRARGRELFRLARTDPALGMIAPFGLLEA
jgi:hypothetical protein